MDFLQWIDWVTADDYPRGSAKSDRGKLQVWIDSHPGSPIIAYTNCQDIKRYWRSPIGKFILVFGGFWIRVSHLKIERLVNSYRWFLWWKIRMIYKGFRTKNMEVKG